ncbi:hypothetical protein LLE49_25465 [Alicyclobacillus tolerans]|uniref:hypothetical protein n=1 Tax=Alicyclobacillus tolerans TaxID=90970 RepID=UPI001F39C145|nr:hypothetical protein [Alicyclobacillus tolerans]MCF8568078.1 hypothetical protein [Alicyclobacillus tolerans]
MTMYVLQDVQQIRTICQQLAQTEQRNAQQLSQQPGLQAIAQQESVTAQQLQQVVSLANRVEQALTQAQPVQQPFSQPVQQPYTPPYGLAPWSQSQVNSAAINAVMRAAQPAPGHY